MAFSFATLCTHALFCGAMLLAMRLLFRHPARMGVLGITSMILCSASLAMRLLLPFEWGFTRTVNLSGFYADVAAFLHRPLSQSGRFGFAPYHLLLWVAGLVASARIGRLFYTQGRYVKYLDSLPDATFLPYTDSMGRARRVRCVTDPASINALTVGFIRPRIVMPGMPMTGRERGLILRHELFHVASGDVWIKLLVECVCTLCWWVPFIGTLRKQVASALEFRADQRATQSLHEAAKVEYLECLLKISRANQKAAAPLAVSFAERKANVLKERFKLVLDPGQGAPLFRALTLLLVAAVVLSTFVVFEPRGGIPDDIQADTFGLDDGAFFLVRHANQGYSLYMDGNYMGPLDDIPEEFAQFPVFDNLEEAGV
ncbi:MAG: M56 family metallopeptidase [Christensenellaceae bacterium]|nr:M56 family metallopeptidase [Christensenellaceae bacterium]